MIKPSLHAWFKPDTWTPEKAYELVNTLVNQLGTMHHDLREWDDLPQGPKDKSERLTDRAAIIARILRKIEKRKSSSPQMPNAESADLNVTNALTEKAWKEPGRSVISFTPWDGAFSIDMLDPQKRFGEELTRRIFVQTLSSVASLLPLKFAAADTKVHRDGKSTLYQIDKKLFPHRQYFGWMGFVPTELSHAQIRDADEVIAVPGKGTIIVTVPGLFDPTDAAQVEQVHRVEMQLAHYNLLRVTDPDVRDAP